MYIAVQDILWVNTVHLNVSDSNKWMKSLKARHCFNNKIPLHVNTSIYYYLSMIPKQWYLTVN